MGKFKENEILLKPGDRLTAEGVLWGSYLTWKFHISLVSFPLCYCGFPLPLFRMGVLLFNAMAKKATQLRTKIFCCLIKAL